MERARKKARSKTSEDSGAGGRTLSRVPPHSIDAEQGVLGCCLRDGGREILTDCIDAKLVPDSFYLPAHAAIFRAMLVIYGRNEPIDEIVLLDELIRMGEGDTFGGMSYLSEVQERIETTAHARLWIDIVKRLYMLRRLILTSTQTIEKCFDQQGEIESFLGDVEQEIFAISQDQISDSAKPISECMDGVLAMINDYLTNRGGSHGLMTGFKDLDQLTFGFHPEEMIVLAARPSVGKTSFAMNIAESVSIPRGGKKPLPTLIFSLEMGTDQLAMRLLCGRAGINLNQLREGYVKAEEQGRLASAAKELNQAPILVDSSGHLNILELRAKARRMKSRYPELAMVIVDYLQLVSGTDNRVQREQQVAEISRGLKGMAKELKIPVLVLSQLNRDSERDKRDPRMSDLRESGSIEQDADVVMILHRPRREDDPNQREPDGEQIRLILAKQRNGPTGVIELAFRRKFTRFENWAAPTGSL